MSSNIKESAIYSKIKILNANDAWWTNKQGLHRLRTKEFNFVGKVEKDQPHILRTAFYDSNKDNKVVSYKDDFCHLNKYIKSEIINRLYNLGEKKVYLVLDDKKGNKKQ